MRRVFTRTQKSALSAASVALAVTFAAGAANAEGIIKNPGDHPQYSVELEPHGLILWDRYWWGDAGFGLGMHAVIPLVDNGPVSTINNNIGIGFGLDWAHFDQNGCGYWYGNRFNRALWSACNASGNSFLFPVYAQWNFFFTKIVSVFGEAGFGVAHDTVSLDGCPAGYDCSDSHTGIYGIFEGGGRFLFGDTVGLIVRVGYPMLTVGVSILL